MSFLDKLERKLGFLTIHNLTMYVVVGQALMFGLFLLSGDTPGVFQQKMGFSLAAFLSGEVWRIFTFMLIPKTLSLFWIIFSLFVFQMIGNALDQYWGAFRFNVYLFIGVLGLLAVSLFFPTYPIGNFYLLTSVFFAFAYLNPNIEFLIFFILPVKVKWLGFLSLGFIILEFFSSGIANQAIIAASVLNFPLFFGADIIRSIKSKKRVNEMNAARKQLESEPFHTCGECGATDISDPDRSFRYSKGEAVCSVCSGSEAD